MRNFIIVVLALLFTTTVVGQGIKFEHGQLTDALEKAKKENKILGAVVNLAGVLTESADTRSWQTLPNQIFMVRMSLPAGTHQLNLSFLNANGNVRKSETLQEIKVSSNQISFLNYRTYD